MGNIIRRYKITFQSLLKGPIKLPEVTIEPEPMELPEGAIFVGVEIGVSLGYDIFVHALVDSNTKKTEKYYFRKYSVGKGLGETEIEDEFTYLGSANINNSSDENIFFYLFYRKIM